jgi:hypothetical protein
MGLAAWAAIPALVTVWSLAEVLTWAGEPEPGACYQRMEGIRFCITTPPDQRVHPYMGHGLWSPDGWRYRYQHQT